MSRVIVLADERSANSYVLGPFDSEEEAIELLNKEGYKKANGFPGCFSKSVSSFTKLAKIHELQDIKSCSLL